MAIQTAIARKGFPRVAATLIIAASVSMTAPVYGNTPDLLDLSLEQLLSVEITSASRKSQSLSETAAAVYVISDEAIRMSGARTIPEALRLAPGLQVARIDGNRWAIGSRGFNGRFANKLLVMVDGRSVYTPSFAGVYWESLDTMIDDIDRIEVIRGPGSSVWGANAVNGVINIITKEALLTQGALLTSDVDSVGGFNAGFRYGAATGKNGHFRFFGKSVNRDSGEDTFGIDVNDAYQSVRLGGRYDRISGKSELSVSAEFYDDSVGESLLTTEYQPPYVSRNNADGDATGYFANAEWTYTAESGSELAIRSFVDDIDRTGAMFGEQSTTFDVDLQWTLPRTGRHEIIVGAGYRRYAFDFEATPNISLLPVSGTDSLFSAFLQDEILFGEGRGRLTLGVKAERDERLSNDTKVMPTVRASWQVSPAASLWGSVTRSIRTPSYADFNVSIMGIGPAIAPLTTDNPTPLPVGAGFTGNVQVTDETVQALEAGLRWQISDEASVDVALFYNDYDDLRDAVQTDTICQPSGLSLQVDPSCIASSNALVSIVTFGNVLTAQSSGIEIAAQWTPSENLRLDTQYAYLDIEFDGSTLNGRKPLFPNPKQQLSIRADWLLGSSMRLGTWLRYVDTLNDYDIDDYWDLNLRWSWQPSDGIELAVVGQHLGEKRRLEFISELGELPPTPTERRIVAQLRWLF